MPPPCNIFIHEHYSAAFFLGAFFALALGLGAASTSTATGLLAVTTGLFLLRVFLFLELP
jgi:hypothetical protein